MYCPLFVWRLLCSRLSSYTAAQYIDQSSASPSEESLLATDRVHDWPTSMTECKSVRRLELSRSETVKEIVKLSNLFIKTVEHIVIYTHLDRWVHIYARVESFIVYSLIICIRNVHSFRYSWFDLSDAPVKFLSFCFLPYRMSSPVARLVHSLQ